MHVYAHQLRDQLMMETSRLCISLHSIAVRMPELNYLKAIVNMLIVIMLKFTGNKIGQKTQLKQAKQTCCICKRISVNSEGVYIIKTEMNGHKMKIHGNQS